MRISINTPVGFNDVGGRANQEDAIYPGMNQLSAGNRVFVVCDGLGGLPRGEVASETVARALGEWMERNAAPEWPVTEGNVREAVRYAQSKLDEVSRYYSSVESMGTTMTMLALGKSGVLAAHIGDSRIYHIRPATGQVLYRSSDHSLVNDLFLKGALTSEEVDLSPKKNILVRAMLSSQVPQAVPDVAVITDVRQGDYFLLCSDGVWDGMSDDSLMEVLTASDKDDGEKLAAIQEMIKEGKDNRTALLVRVDDVQHEAGEMLPASTEAAMCDKRVARHEVAEPAQALDDSPAAAVVPPVPVIPADGSAAQPPEIPAAAMQEELLPNAAQPPLSETGYVPGSEEVMNNHNAPKQNNKRALKRAAMILLASLLLAGAILGIFFLGKPKSAPAPKPVATDTIADPDVSIDSMLPEMPADSLPVGTDVAVPRAPGIGNVELPNTAPTPSTPRYSTGTNVKVPRAPRYNGSGDLPYDPDDDWTPSRDEGDRDDVSTTAGGYERDPEPQPQSQPQPKPQPQAQQATTPPPPSRSSRMDDPAKPNNGGVPMPKKRQRNTFETP